MTFKNQDTYYTLRQYTSKIICHLYIFREMLVNVTQVKITANLGYDQMI